jgi:tRNA modification GTPase TrmE
MLTDTIVAISTSLSEGAISIIRMSGSEAIEIASSVFSKNLLTVPANTIHYGNIVNQEEVIDEVLVSVFRAPKTYTREDVVEINCHGGVYISQKILALLLSRGARLAMPGEFTQRAFLNGRIDLTQAEAVQDLIVADSESSRKLAIQGIKGSIRKLLDPLLEAMLDTIAHIEVNIDYPEYDDVIQLTNDVVLPELYKWLNQLDEILKKAESGRILKQGVKTVIIGAPNVGKSSLFNALLEEDKAIVTEIAGTTRDLVEGVIRLDNVTLHLIDTAGLHETTNIVEQIGIEKTKKAVEEAELILFVLDSTREKTVEEIELYDMVKERNTIIIYNKGDIKKRNGISISALHNEIGALITEINKRYQYHQHQLDQGVINNERQTALIAKARDYISQAITATGEYVELDLLTIDIQNAYTSLKEILGEVKREDLLDALFENFCLGK